MFIDLASRLPSMRTSSKTTVMEPPVLVCASIRMATCRLTSAASTWTLTLFGVVNGKLHGSSTPRPIPSLAKLRSTTTISRRATSSIRWRKISRTFLLRLLMPPTSSPLSIKLKPTTKRRLNGCTRTSVMSSSAWEEPCPSQVRSSTGRTQKWWKTE